MTASLTDLVDNIPARHVDQLKGRIREAAQREIVRRIGDNLEDYSAVTLEQLYRCLATGNFAHLGMPEARPDDEDEREATDHAEICRRIRYLRALKTDEDWAEELKKCNRNPRHFINQWVWMADPRPDADGPDVVEDFGDLELSDEPELFEELLAEMTDLGRTRLMVRPIVLWAQQVKLIAWIFWLLKRKTSGLGKKSRDVGFSVIACALGIWFWRFRSGFSVGYGSRKESLVDRIGNLDALFPKMRFILHRLPTRMLPRGFDWRVHSKELLLINPQNGSEIKGEGGANLGNAGRSTIYFMDEYSLVQHAEKVHDGLSANTNTVVYFGRSAGTQTYMYELEARGVYPVFYFPWYYDPRKLDDPSMVGDPSAPSEWANAMRTRLGAAKFAEIYGCDDDESLENVLIPIAWVQAAVDVELPACNVDPVAGIDVADGGDDDSVLCRRQGPYARWWSWENLEAKTLAVPAASICSKQGVRWAYFDAQGVGQDFGGEFLERAEGFRVLGFHGQLPASKYRIFDDFPHDGREPQTCFMRFANQLTEQWWAMRLRFRRTFEYLEWKRSGGDGEAPYAPEDLISIDDEPVLRRQLKRTFHRTSQGKIRVQDKKELSKSPDRADALAMTECIALQHFEEDPTPQRSGVLRSRFHNISF